MNCEGWSSGATKLGWADRATAGGSKMGLAWRHWCGRFQLGNATADRDGSRVMVVWVLGSKMGVSRMGVGSGVTAWAASLSTL